ncbi:hypothetical protein C2E25_06795 [Geothermobacter hydrogeniphilus]|uniref:Uncharacterized protein n=1 Tax=Geothermobacter hydrogeniphilus TaxID=1969733 RepID=A0A2K2HB80_9BACT|nr:hypothetical protein [Geothermobacter hydrogeniphilus]PNU20578.1 hypothetical protein C2E25_06795 [Geothermobacter hydrogeniphilus]
METETIPAYCPHCCKTVIIHRHPGRRGLRSLFAFRSGDAGNNIWHCSNCRRPVASPPTTEAGPEEQNNVPCLTESNRRTCPHCRTSIGRTLEFCPNCQQHLTPMPPLRAADCHICRGRLYFQSQHEGAETICDHCRNPVVLPRTRGRQTTAPAVIRLPSDPRRPGIRTILCGQCRTRMTYPDRLTGRKVNCTACRQPFELP